MPQQGPDLAFINRAQQQVVAPANAGGKDQSHLLRALMYALQGYDAINSAHHFQHGGQHESNPLMQPFSHGGAPTMMAGFALGDLLRDAMMRHQGSNQQNSATATQALQNLLGIMQTNSNGMHPLAKALAQPQATPGPIAGPTLRHGADGTP